MWKGNIPATVSSSSSLIGKYLPYMAKVFLPKQFYRTKNDESGKSFQISLTLKYLRNKVHGQSSRWFSGLNLGPSPGPSPGLNPVSYACSNPGSNPGPNPVPFGSNSESNIGPYPD